MSTLESRLFAAFAAACGGKPDLVARAPGRVNLIGEHTDYNDGFVLPVAIGVQTLVAARRRHDGIVRAIAVDYGTAESRFANEGPIGHDSSQPWSAYVRGMCSAMQAAGYRVPAADLVLAGDVPRGAGLSSSASVAVAVGTALSALGGLGLGAVEIAKLAQAAECDFVGTKCGIMDQLASACGRAGHALLIDCRSLTVEPVPMPPELGILIVHSGVVRGLVEGAYNARRRECEDAAAGLGVTALRDADASRLNSARSALTPIQMARARHVIGENARTLAAVQALASHDLQGLGELMAQSHASLRDDFQVSLPVVDDLVALLQAEIGREGGARMTGGGFGGAVVAVMPREQIDDVARRVADHYRTPAGLPPLMLRETAANGASCAP